ncbi:hypothetical protein K6119_01990 [Paracrocinitomix mangrovi]|uniref:hypothetical protein n=1 Tax=Paracrocinitomix mangrovi TaxID=2862509 RepID=UPI001C8E5B07|nr:hypothetical protein [Paracrocinitomix mangrovi]UKN02289.1 hypothetical protein K6119_01990 [Paracrocinitomix mangrovi]
MAHTTTTSGVAHSTSAKIQVTSPAKTRDNEQFSGIKWLDNLVGEYNFNRYGIYAIALLLVGCLGGVAVGLGSMTSSIEILILVIPTMVSLTMILAVAPMRLLLWTVLFTCLLDIIMIVYNILV